MFFFYFFYFIWQCSLSHQSLWFDTRTFEKLLLRDNLHLGLQSESCSNESPLWDIVMCCKKKHVSGKPHTLPYMFTLEQWHSTCISLLIGYFLYIFFYNSLTLSCLLPQEFSHSSSLRTNWTQSRQCNFVLSQLVIRSKKEQEQEQEQQPEPEKELEQKQEQVSRKLMLYAAPLLIRLIKIFGFFFFFFNNWFDHNQTNKQMTKPEQ